MSTRSVLLFALFFVLLTVPVAAQESDTLASPFDLMRQAEGEPVWAPLLRLRAAEDAYRDSDRWWRLYVQLRAQEEAQFGHHAAALHFMDVPFPPRDTVGTLPEGRQPTEAFGLLAAAADTAQVLMLNERHHAAPDRLLTLQLLPVLYEKGYRYFAAEALLPGDSTLHERGYPLLGVTGTYTDEPIFGAVVREALRLGYTLVPYEIEPDQRDRDDGLTRQQRRDSTQAQNLYDRTLRTDPDARVLVHAGYGHIEEEVTERWSPMAHYFREIAGIDPVTVDQTTLSERSTPGYEHPLYRAAADAGWLDDVSVVLVDSTGSPLAPVSVVTDLQVLTPRTSYASGRPTWMALDGRRVAVDLDVRECAERWCIVEARYPEEPLAAVPLDRAEVDHSTTARLFLPPDQTVTLFVRSEDGTVLRQEEVMTARHSE